ncbi:MAG: acyl carrier protein [Mogibacterium sp.]|nr:acyl carrier protein [Mogibacterium sp.]
MFEQVEEIIRKYSPAEEIRPESLLVDDLELTSLDVVSMVGDFEEAFDIEVPDEDLMKFVTVSDIVEYISARR